MIEITQADRDAAEDASYNVEGCMCYLCLSEVARQFARHREAAAAEERAKIVAFLRETIFNCTLADIPSAIEAGEHLK